jgi:hypothetical protein
MVAASGRAAGASLRLHNRRMTVRRGRTKARVTCRAAGGCRGRLVLRSRGAKPTTLGSGRVNLRRGQTATVTVTLTKAGRAALRKASTSVALVLR